MANQKRQSQPSICFFDEMQDKMRTEDIKRRKIAKTNHSKPELLFLQFKPSGKENFNSFSNKCNSHAFEINKKPWKPPIKIHSECELYQISPEEKGVEVNKSKIENDNFNLLKDSYREETKNLPKTADNTSHFSKTFDDTNINEKEPQSLNVFLESDNLVSGTSITKKSAEYPESDIICLSDSPCPSQINNSFNNAVDVEALTQPNLKVTATVSDGEFCHENNLKGDNSNMIVKNNTRDEMKEETMDNYNSSQAAHVKKSQQIKYSQENKENMDIDFDPASVHNKENVQQNNSDDNKPKNVENTDKDFDPAFVHNKENVEPNNSDCNDNKPNNPNEIGEVNDSVKLIERDEHENSYGENQDIINSIDMILSEGQNCNSEEKVEDNNEEMGNEKKENEEILAEPVWNNRASGSPENINVESRTSQAKESIVEKLNPNECSSENQKNSELGNDLTPEVKSEDPQSVAVEKGDILFSDTPKKEDSLSLNEEASRKTIENSVITPSKTVNSETNNDVCESAQNMQSDNAMQDRDNGLIEDDYSCLMISHSQLLEIEQKYYETPQKASVNNTTTPINSPDLRGENKPTAVSVTTQTDKLQSSQLNPLPQTPVVKWPKRLQESQKQLRDTIQEINRLNAILLKVRQEIWPQRHSKSEQESNAQLANRWQR